MLIALTVAWVIFLYGDSQFESRVSKLLEYDLPNGRIKFLILRSILHLIHRNLIAETKLTKVF